jgi:phosphoglycerate kinase
MKNIQEAPIKPRSKVLVRCDLDVAIKNGEIVEPFRLEKSLKTLKFIQEKGALPIIMGHIGKPEGKYIAELSTKHLESFFSEHLEDYQLMENLRFDPREEANDEQFAQQLAGKCDFYINESFATCHREHASIVGVTKFISSFAGFVLTEEIKKLDKLVTSPKRPFTAIVGGVKLESKLPTINKLLRIADFVLLGGKLGLAWNEEVPHNLIIPSDYAPEEKDIGPQTIKEYKKYIQISETILWAGPMGLYEEENYKNGTKELAQELEKASLEKETIIGGGDTISALNEFININNIGFVSTGGGAMLQYLANGTLPGIEVLK